MFQGLEAKKSTRAMARWHWLERRPWTFQNNYEVRTFFSKQNMFAIEI